MKAQVGMKVRAYEGSCIGIIIQSTEWQGEIIKVNKKSIRVRLTESTSMRGKKITDTPYNCAQTIHVIPADPNFEKKCNSNALFAREINLVTQPSFDCEQGINSQVQTVCSNADAVLPVLGIVFCKNEKFSLSRKTYVLLWNEPRISHVRLP